MSKKKRMKGKRGSAGAVTFALAASVLVGGGFAGFFYYKANYSDGWHTDKDGRRFYIEGNGVRANGFTTIDNSDYIFSPDGFTQSGWQEYEGFTYYLDDACKGK